MATKKKYRITRYKAHRKPVSRAPGVVVFTLLAGFITLAVVSLQEAQRQEEWDTRELLSAVALDAPVAEVKPVVLFRPKNARERAETIADVWGLDLKHPESMKIASLKR